VPASRAVIPSGLTLAPSSTVSPEPVETSDRSVTEPAKVMRIGSMVKQLLDEVRHAARRGEPRAAGRDLRAVGRRAGQALSPDLQEELRSLTLPFRDDTRCRATAELRVAKAQLVGWLEGLFHGIQATLFAQQLAARQQLEQMRQLPPGAAGAASRDGSPGTYL
jgi:hypothetical protein